MPFWSFVLLDGPQHGRLSFPGAQHAKTEGLNNWIAFSYSFSSMGLCVVGTGGRTGEMNFLPLEHAKLVPFRNGQTLRSLFVM